MRKKNARRRRTTIHSISDDLLDAVFQLIPSPGSLVRAPATCKLWCRVIGDEGFLHRFRRINGPSVVLGHYLHHDDGGAAGTHFVSLPAPEGKKIIAGDIGDRLSLDFLTSLSYPDMSSAVLHDCRGGLLAFHHNMSFSILVCNPWTRQHRAFYMKIPDANMRCIGVFLLDGDLSNFRVLCVHLVGDLLSDDGGSITIEASVLSARDKDWVQLSTRAVHDILPVAAADGTLGFRSIFVELVGRAGGSIFWYVKHGSNAVIELDESTGEFSCFTLPVPLFAAEAGITTIPSYHNRTTLRVICVDTGIVHLVRIVDDELEVLRYARGGGSCVVETRVPVPQHVAASTHEDKWRRYFRQSWCFSDRAGEVAPESIMVCEVLRDAGYNNMFTVDLQNLKLEECKQQKWTYKDDGDRAFKYELPLTISACL